MRAPQRASRRAATVTTAAARDARAARRSALRRAGRLTHDAAKRAPTHASPAPIAPQGAAGAELSASQPAGGDEAAPPAPALAQPDVALAAVARAVLLGRPRVAAALLDTGAMPRGHGAAVLLVLACADAPLRVPVGACRDAKGPDASGASAMRAVMAVLLSRRAIRDEMLPGGGGRVSATLARRGLWDRALLLSSDACVTRTAATQARATLLAVAAERGDAAPLAALLAALERRTLARLRGARSARRRLSAAYDARGLARTLCTYLLPMCTRPPRTSACDGGERAHCMALVGASARRLRCAADGGAIELPPPLADLPEADDDDDVDMESDSDDDDEQDDALAEGPADPVALRDILPRPDALFPAPAAAHDAACAAVVASLADGAPLTWSRGAHAACPPALRASVRAAACALHAVGLPPELLEAVVARAAEATLWPGLRWEAPGEARYIHTPPPTSLAQLERR